MMKRRRTWITSEVFSALAYKFRQRYLMVTLFLFVIVGKYLWMLVNGQTFTPTWVYQHLIPWQSEQKPPWNVLSADGLFEFLPWRTIVMESVANGRLPLVNPYAASTQGGQPLLANGQSGFFYPLHWLFWLMPTAWASNTLMVSVIIHMAILAVGTYFLARRLSASTVGGVIAAIGFSQSATITTWLPLSSHLTVVAWLPWMWLASINRSFKWLAGLTAMSLLAGHLQLSMYALLTSAIVLFGMNWRSTKSIKLIFALVFGLLLALCQLLPSVELGQQSHRGGVAASPDGYTAYVGNAMPAYHFITWLIPNFFGNPNANAGSSWILTSSGIPNNYAEWALYTGVLSPVLFLAGMFTFKAFRLEHKVVLLVATLAFFVAIGSPLCAVMYYGIPGFAATGNPARVLPVLSLAVCLIAGVSVSRIRLRHFAFALLLLGVITGVSFAFANLTVTRLSLPKDITSALATDAVLSHVPIILMSTLVAFVALRLKARFPTTLWVVPLIILVDLFLWTSAYHPVGKLRDAVQSTPGLEYLKQNAKTSPIACIVGNWSMNASSPNGATLPPNLLTLHRLHDIAMYDSLILRSDKTKLESVAGVSLMPPENGNLLRIPTIETASRLGAEWVVVPQVTDLPQGWEIAYVGNDMTILHRMDLKVPKIYTANRATTSLRVGIFLSLMTLTAMLLSLKPRRQSQVLV